MSRSSKRNFALSDKRRALLQALLTEEGVAPSLPERIPLRRDAESYPLSFAQQRLWFLDQFEPNSPLYNTPAAMSLTGTLNVPALEQSLNEIVNRHESLRTSFISVDGRPQQVIAPTLNVPLQLFDLCGLSAGQRKTEARRLISEGARRSFDLKQSPLFRASLFRLAEDEHVLFINMHHIVSDGWSFGVLFQELTALYEVFSRTESSRLPELPIQYADYAAWQREWLRGEILEKQLSYWKQKLGGELPVLELPTDRPRPAVQTFRGGERQFLLLPSSLREALEALSRREGGTLFMTVLATFKALLSRYTAQDDIIVGSPIANRNRAEIEGLIGFFVNTLALRTDLSSDPTFRELLGLVRETTLGAYEHQDIPFERLMEELQPQRSLSQAALFQVMFVLQNAPGRALELQGLTLHPLSVEIGASKFDLTLFIWQEGEELRATVEYSTDLFDASTIQRLLRHFQILLEAVVANPDQHLSELPILTNAESHQLLVEWNDSQAEYPRDQNLHQLFEKQVERTPDTVAVLFEDQRLTYAELNCRANQLAHYLRQGGVGPEVRVGISMERSLEMVVGLLGILKAGAAYVPLDPGYPQERLSFTLKDAAVPVILTQQRLVKSLPEHGAKIVCLDTDWSRIGQQSKTNLEGSATADNLAYVIYTSGSTGRPKGVGLPHAALVNLIAWHLSTLTVAVRTLQFASLSFDVSFYELFVAWCSGGSVFIFPEAMRSDVAGLARFISEKRIEKAVLPVVVLQQLAEAYGDQPQVFASLKEMTTTGEQMHLTRPVVKMFEALPNCTLHNHYGPSESHVVTAFTLKGGPSQWPPLPPIGRPIVNTQIYLLDPHLQPVPVGVPGELYIGGLCLARGYLNRSDLTAERFIASPFSKVLGARLYKTGDLARYLPDGNVEYLGRIDHQVKIRGFRIELGEIEATLSQHAGVHECVVLVREDVPGNQRLVAYLVPAVKPAPSISDLRHYLQKHLPEYMLPSAFVMIEELPLTPNRKVDRKALPAPDQDRPELESRFVAPRTAAEEVVAGIWSDVLGVKQVGVYDNFFELGGHSLLATQVISRVRTAFQVDQLSLRRLFEFPTVEALTGEIVRIWDGAEIADEIALTYKELAQFSEDQVKLILSQQTQ